MNDKLDVNDVINALLEQISTQAKDIAILKASLAANIKNLDADKKD